MYPTTVNIPARKQLKSLRLLFVLQPSTAGDVSNSESDEAETAVQDALQVEPVERWRSFSEGEQVQYTRQAFILFFPLESNVSVFEAASLLYRILSRNVFEGEFACGRRPEV